MDTNGHELMQLGLCSRCCAAWEHCRLFGSREAAKPRREMHKFKVQQASRGRESAGAASRMFFSPRMNTDFHG